MNPVITMLFGEVKGYLHSFLAPGPNKNHEQVYQYVKILCDNYNNEVIECLDIVKGKLTLDQYYDVKNAFRYLEYEFNYDEFKLYL